MKNEISRFKLFLAVAFFTITKLSLSQSIYTNPITGTNPSNSAPYITGQTVATGISVSGLDLGVGVGNTNATDRFSADGWTTNANVNTNDYFSWTISPDNCYDLDFTSLVIAYQRSGNGPQSLALRSSADGYGANIWTTTAIPTTEQISTISLTAIAFQNLTTPITFRLYGWAAGSGAGTFSMNSFTFNGSVISTNTAVPGTITGTSSVCSGSNSTLTVNGSTGNVQWQTSTNNTTFNNITGAISANYTTPNIYSTTYYRVGLTIGSCPAIYSNSFAVGIISPSITALNGFGCAPSNINLQVSEACQLAGSIINWYPAATGGSLLNTGVSFITPVLDSTTTYYASSEFSSGPTISTVNRSSTLQRGLLFDTFVPLTLNSVKINTNGPGSITLELRDNLNQPVAGATAVVFNAAAGTNTVPLGWTIPTGMGYRIIKTAGTIQLSRSDPFTFPIGVGGVLSIKSGIDAGSVDNSRYFYFYNWNVSTIRIPVVANINTPTLPIFTQVEEICSGESLNTLPTTSNNGISGIWEHELDNTETTTYTFTPMGGQCASTTTLTIIVNPLTSNTTTASACDSYTWSVNGTTYTTSGTYISVTGCHTETLVLTVNTSSVYYVDADGDGFGSAITGNFCSMPSTGYTLNNTDCNDAEASIYPGATELCNSVDDNCSGFIDEGCPSTIAGEEPFNALLAPSSVYSYCNSFYGTLAGAYPSANALSTCVTGEDVWYSFTALSSGVTIFIGSYVNDLVIELQDANGNLIEFENSVNGPGTEVLTTTALIPGNEYRFAVRNNNSNLNTGGQYSACVRHLRRGGADSGTNATWPSTLSTCSLFKASYCGGTGVQYRYTWTGLSGTATGQVFTKTQTSDYLNVTAVSPSLQAGCTYNVLVTAIYAIPNGAGVNELVELPALSPTTITISPVANVALRSTDQLSNGPRYRGSIVAALPWVCGVTNWRWRFTEVNPLTLQTVGLPIEQNRGAASNFINLNTVTALQYGKTYAVHTAPVFSYTGTNYQWGPVTYMAIIGSAGMIIDPMEDVLQDSEKDVSQDSEKDVAQDAMQDSSKDVTQEFELSVFPNPTNGDGLTLSLSGITSDNVQVKVYDALGRKIGSERFVVDGTLQTELNFQQELSDGLYLIEVTLGTSTKSARLLIQR